MTPLLFLISLAVTLASAHVLVDRSVDLAHHLKLPHFIIGFTLLALGTSLPEIIVCINAALAGRGDVVVNNIYGSNLVNVGLGIGLGLLLIRRSAGKVNKSALLSGWAGLGAVCLVGLLLLDAGLNRLDGLLLLATVVLMTVILMRIGAAAEPESEHAHELSNNSSIPVLLAIIASAIAGLQLGAHFLIQHATDLARTIGLSEHAIGFFLLAAGTSGPEIVLSLQTALRGRFNLLLGNITGSNLFNLLMGLGLPALLAGIQLDAMDMVTQRRDLVAALVAAGVLIVAIRFHNGWFARGIGLMAILAYSGYAVWVLESVS